MHLQKKILFALGFLIVLAACADDRIVTHAEYMNVAPGMCYQDVVGIVHHNGSKMGRGEFAEGALVAQPGEDVYIWKNPDGSNMTIAVRADRVMSVGQWNLH